MEESIKITGAEYDELGDMVVIYLSHDEDDSNNVNKYVTLQQVITDSIS